jgi:hypothetical protein
MTPSRGCSRCHIQCGNRTLGVSDIRGDIRVQRKRSRDQPIGEIGLVLARPAILPRQTGTEIRLPDSPNNRGDGRSLFQVSSYPGTRSGSTQGSLVGRTPAVNVNRERTPSTSRRVAAFVPGRLPGHAAANLEVRHRQYGAEVLLTWRMRLRENRRQGRHNRRTSGR